MSMFYSTYVPVNVNRVNCAVYSNEKVFDKEHLLRAHDYLTGVNQHNGVSISTEGVTFLDNPEYCWRLDEVFLAYEALQNAEKNNFSFYMVKDLDGIPQLFVSKSFANQRILVNAFTTRSILVTNPQHVSKVASMIDKSLPYTYCQELYSLLESISMGNNKYLDGLIVGAGSDYEHLILNQFTITHGNILERISAELIEELRGVIVGEIESDTFTLSNGYIKRTNLEYWPTLLLAQAKFLVNLYDSCKNKKKNYTTIVDENMEDALYVSTNSRYLVHSRTLECLTIVNSQVRELVKVMAHRESNSSSELDLVWRLASTVK